MTRAFIFALHLIARIGGGAIKTGAFLVLASQSRKLGRAMASHHVRVVDGACAAIHAVVGARIRLTLLAPKADITLALRTAETDGALAMAAAESFAYTVFATMALEVVGTLATCTSIRIAHANSLILAAQLVAIAAIVTVESFLADASFAAVLRNGARGAIQTEIAALRRRYLASFARPTVGAFAHERRPCRRRCGQISWICVCGVHITNAPVLAIAGTAIAFAEISFEINRAHAMRPILCVQLASALVAFEPTLIGDEIIGSLARATQFGCR